MVRFREHSNWLSLSITASKVGRRSCLGGDCSWAARVHNYVTSHTEALTAWSVDCVSQMDKNTACTTSSMPALSRWLSMQHWRGLECAQLLTTLVSTHCCVAASGTTTVAMISRPLPTCSALRPMSYSAESHWTLLTFCICTCQATLIFPTNFALVLNMTLIDKTKHHRFYHPAAIQTLLLALHSLYNAVYFTIYIVRYLEKLKVNFLKIFSKHGRKCKWSAF